MPPRRRSGALGFAFDDLGLAEVVSFTSTGNLRSQAVMERLGMTRDPADDFDHPMVEDGNPLRYQVLWRMTVQRWRERERGVPGSSTSAQADRLAGR